MKLIHRPTGEELELSPIASESALKGFPQEYIRAELPEHWRVEGYDKSWEWSQAESIGGLIIKNHKWVGNSQEFVADAWFNDEISGRNELISRAEFEHHIYNPWKREQTKATGITSEDYRKLELEDLRAEAEKMGYELVRKPRKPTEFECDWNKYRIDQFSVLLTDKDDNQVVEVRNADFETLIEKYNQFKSNQ